MFGTFAPDGRRFQFKYNSLVLNDMATDEDSGYQLDIVAFGQTFDAVQEAHALAEGMESHRPRTVQLLVSARGTVHGTDVADLFDNIMALNNAFNPIEVWRNDSTTDYNRGFIKFTGWLPTADEANYPTGAVPSGWAHPDANYAAGEIPVFVLARSIRNPVERVSDLEGNSADFALYLQCADPRLYYGVSESAERSGEGTLTVDNSLAAVGSPAVLTIDATGSAVSNAIDLTYNGDTLSLAVAAGTTVIVDMEHHEVYVDGTLDMSIVSSGTFWDDLIPESSDVTIASDGDDSLYDYSVTWFRALA